MKTKALLCVMLLISLRFLAACSPTSEGEPIATQSVMTPEQDVVTALADYLAEQGAPLAGMDLQVKTIAGDYARVEVISTDPALPGGFNAFMKRDNGIWMTVVSGSGMEKEQVEALGVPRSVWPESWLSQATQPEIPAPETSPLSAMGCPMGTVEAQTQSLVDEARGFCLLYPATHTVEQIDSGNTEIVLGTLMNHIDPRVSIVVEELGGRSLQQAVDEFLAGYEGFDIAQTPMSVGGENAVQLDNIPGQDYSRKVMVAHDGFLYQVSIAPYDPAQTGTIAQAEELSKVVIDSFRFIRTDQTLSAQPETATGQGLCPDVPRPAVALFIPGEGYEIVDPVTGAECFTTLDGDIPGLFQAENGAIYYSVLQEDQFVVKRLAGDGTSSLLSYTAVNRDDSLLYHGFVVSPDGGHIAWSATSAGVDYAGPEVSNLWVADMEGGSLATLLSETGSGEEERRTPVPVRFSEDNSTLFYTYQPIGMGGIWNAFVGRYDSLYALRLEEEAEPALLFDCGEDRHVLCIGDFIESQGQLTTLAYVNIDERSVVIVNGMGDTLNAIETGDDYVGYPTFGPGGEMVFYGADLDEGPNASILPLKGAIYRVAPPTAPYELLASDPGLMFPFDWLDGTRVVVGYAGSDGEWGKALVRLDGSLEVLATEPSGSFVDILSH